MQLMAARQEAVHATLQHSTQQHAALEQAAGREQQLQQRILALQATVTDREADVLDVNKQLAAAVESCKRLQENHGKVSRWPCVTSPSASILSTLPHLHEMQFMSTVTARTLHPPAYKW